MSERPVLTDSLHQFHSEMQVYQPYQSNTLTLNRGSFLTRAA